ncbi:Dipeptide transport ATP-binding protein DppD (TC 3.A.1.5.2) [Streptococcus pyogenes]|nr:Dipeptide transport ATP-binding protein DppD (TC 3.A.1.5.2) [Streptococcus pyogenes]
MVLDQLRSFADKGISVIFITHDIVAASQIADRITIFKEGKAIETAQLAFLAEVGSNYKQNLRDVYGAHSLSKTF